MKQRDDKSLPGEGHGSIDDLTPPTHKYGPAETPTEKIEHIDIVRAVHTDSSAGASDQNPTAMGPASAATVFGEVPTQDLSDDGLLRSAPRVQSENMTCPALAGIPLLAKLGQGGMGAVYYGVHPRLRSEVAVKVLPFHLAAQDSKMVRRFYREAQIAAKVRSPHLVSVIDVNEESGLFFLVMEYVCGMTMGQYVKKLIERGETGMPELDALDTIIGTCEGLDAAHQAGIVHRDLKPENIMVPRSSREANTFELKRAKLMDLGLARFEEGQQTLTGEHSAMGNSWIYGAGAGSGREDRGQAFGRLWHGGDTLCAAGRATAVPR